MLKVLANLVRWVFYIKPCFKMRMLCLLFSSFICKQVKCQDLSSPRFFKLNIQSLPFSATPNYSQLGGLSVASSQPESDYGPNFLYEAALRYPIKMKGNTKIFGELAHKNEFINGYYSPQLDETEELELFQTSSSFILMHNFGTGSKFTSVLQISSNSAKGVTLSGGALRFSNIGLYEKSIANGSFGIGAAVSYDTRLSIMPILKYEADLGKDWSIEALLPSKILFAKNYSKSSRLVLGVKGSTATYLINDNEMVANDLVGTHYRRMSANAIIGYEKMLTPLLGLSLEMGTSVPLRSGIYNLNDRQNVLYDFNNNKVSPHFRVGIFLALPQ